MSTDRLPPLPQVSLSVMTHDRRDPFLELHRVTLDVGVNGDSVGVAGYDYVTRRALDAAIFVAHYVENGIPYVYLRSAVRPPLSIRGGEHSASMWEMPAGLIEPGEDPIEAASRELQEELGFVAPSSQFEALGKPMYPCPAMIAECHHFFHVRVDPNTRGEPTGDGSPYERGAVLCALALPEALKLARAGYFQDTKTDLALRRLEDLYAAEAR